MDDKWVEFYPDFVDIRKDLMLIEGRCFGPHAGNEAAMQALFKEATLPAALRKGDSVVGYCLVNSSWPDTAYVAYTAILPEYQGQGLVGVIMSAIESELKRRGYKYLSRDARIENGYADKVEKFYGDRIKVKYDHASEIGPLRFFRITLEDTNALGPTT